MSEIQRTGDEVALAALLRAARNSYAAAIRGALAAAGCDDMPRDGVYVLGSMARTGIPMSQIIADLRVSKQAAGQLVDTLVLRGYVDRAVDVVDRRRMTLTLTERGQAAAQAAREACRHLETAVVNQVGAEYVAHTRATLWALVHARQEATGAAAAA